MGSELITKEQYNQALKLISDYIVQEEEIRLRKAAPKPQKQPIQEWFFGKSCSGRLKNILLNKEKGYPFPFVEDVTKDKFMRLPRAGKVSWEEFVRLRWY